MLLGKKIIAIIPARGGSKGIPGKNLRLLNNKPLLFYAIDNALRSIYIDKVVVTTEDERIMELAEYRKVEVVKRSRVLSQDSTTLDPVIYDAVKRMEDRENEKYDIIVTMQPTSPLLLSNSLDSAIKILVDSGKDTVLAATNATHLYWSKGSRGSYRPMFKKRCNRQFLTPMFCESGAFLITNRKNVTKTSRIGKNIELFVLSEREGIDIDTYCDWWIAENYLIQPRIGFRVDGDTQIGLGHVYRSITLASKIFNPGLIFFVQKTKKLAIEKIKESNYPLITFNRESEIADLAKKAGIDILINDILDTSLEYMVLLKQAGLYVVNFEDLGLGNALADVVINALYESSHRTIKYCYGYKYFCLRDEFQRYPYVDIKEQVKNVMLMFGGVDINNLTLRTLEALERIGNKKLNISIVLGLGYQNIRVLELLAAKMIKQGYVISIHRNVSNIAKKIYDADIVVTSNGRTIYEVASLGVPCISISQNLREEKHLFSHYTAGIRDLGRASEVTAADIMRAIEELINNYEKRKKMNSELKKFDLRKGIDRVLNRIIGGYQKSKNNSEVFVNGNKDKN